jgi:hypothetical protein
MDTVLPPIEPVPLLAGYLFRQIGPLIVMQVSPITLLHVHQPQAGKPLILLLFHQIWMISLVE